MSFDWQRVCPRRTSAAMPQCLSVPARTKRRASARGRCHYLSVALSSVSFQRRQRWPSAITASATNDFVVAVGDNYSTDKKTATSDLRQMEGQPFPFIPPTSRLFMPGSPPGSPPLHPSVHMLKFTLISPAIDCAASLTMQNRILSSRDARRKKRRVAVTFCRHHTARKHR